LEPEQRKSERRDVHFSGHVQGVGFRYTTRSIAARFAVTGWVRNLPDGRVQLLVEGQPAVLDRFVAAIQAEMARYITTVDVAVGPATGEFVGFEVRR